MLKINAYLQGVWAEASQHLVYYLICDRKVSFQLVIPQSGSSCTISAYSATGNGEHPVSERTAMERAETEMLSKNLLKIDEGTLSPYA